MRKDPDTPVDINELGDHGKLSLLATLINEAVESMSRRQGLRCGLYLRNAHTLLKMLNVSPIPCDDIDLENGIFWPTVDDHPALAPFKPGLDDNTIYNLILHAAGAFTNKEQMLEVGKHLCLCGVAYFTKPSFAAFVRALEERSEAVLEGTWTPTD